MRPVASGLPPVPAPRDRQRARRGRLAWAALVAALVVPGGLAAQALGTVTGRVSGEGGEPLAGATVSAAGTQVGAVSRGDGSYRFQIRPGTYELRARLIGYESRRDTVRVEAGGTVTANFALPRAATSLQAVAITGARGGERTVVDAPVPIDVLVTADLKSTGRVETAQMIQMLAPSFNFPRATIADGTDHVRPATLRGLGPDQMLVLINGKRRHTSALVNVNGTIGRGSTGVDLNAIPASMVERIEVLRDGAAAQYGSDAIAGVLNIILKSTTPGEVSLSGGQTSEGDGTLALLAADAGLPFGPAGFVHVGGEYRDREGTNRTRPDPRLQYFAGDPRNDQPAPLNHWQGDSETSDAVGFLNAAYDVGGAELYGFAGLGRREGEAAGFFRRPNDVRTVRAIHPDGFLPLIQSEIWDGSATGGLRGETLGTRWDASLAYGRNSFRFDVANSNNVTLGAASPTEFYVGTLGFDQLTANLDLARQFRPADRPLRLAAGAEFRRDGYWIEEGEPDSYRDGGVRILDGPSVGALGAVGAQVFPGFRPSDATDRSRESYAGYADLELDLSSQLLLGFAGRYEDYTDFGSTTTGKVTARWAPVRRVALRGSFNSGFRAPSLGQSYFSSTATNFIAGVPFDVRTFPVSSPEAQVLGAEPLRPETSTNYSLGLVLEPLRALAVTVDFYQIEIEDRIVFSENFTGADIQRLFEEAGLRGVSGGRFFTNAIDTRTRGVDVVVNGGVSAGGGLLRATAAYNRNRNRVTRVRPTPSQLGNRGEVLFGRVERARIEEGQPQDNLVLSGTFDRGPLTLVGRTQRFGEVTSRQPVGNAGLDQTFAAKWITDLSVGYRVLRRVTLTLGADNVFDVYPDENDDPGNVTTNVAGNANFGIFPYNGISPFGFNGRFVYLRATVGL